MLLALGVRTQLIINADDLGFDDAITAGIVRTLEHGVVSSTTVMMASSGVEARIRPYLASLEGRTGVHLQLTAGKPLTDGSSLTTSDGCFPRRPAALPNRLDPGDVFTEWMAQIDALAALGIKPTHIDSHHYVHVDPRLIDVYVAVAHKSRLPCRGGNISFARSLRAHGLVCPSVTDADWTMSNPTLVALKRCLKRAARWYRRVGSYELVTHPGYVPQAGLTSYSQGRGHELALLSSNAARELVDGLGFELVSYAGLTT